MSRILVACLFALGCAAAPFTPSKDASAARPSKDPSGALPSKDAAAALLALEDQLMAAIGAKDRAALEALLADDFELYSPGQPVAGKIAFVAAAVSQELALLSVEGEGVQARSYGELGVIWGMQRSRVRLADGSVAIDLQAFTDLARLRNGRWQFVLAHSAPVGDRQ